MRIGPRYTFDVKKLLIPVTAVLILYVWYQMSLMAVDGSSKLSIRVTVNPGMSKGEIAEMLDEKGLIRSPFFFRFYATIHRSTLFADIYDLSPAMDVEAIVDVMEHGQKDEISITIPEGFTVKDIDRLIARKGLAATGSIVTCAQTCDFSPFAFLPSVTRLAKRGGKIEGYLFPDTYFVSKSGFKPEVFLSRLLTTFEERVVKDLKTDIEASGHSLHQIVTMASLIEEETRTSEERPVVSGILWKRFDATTGLGVDAAVRYIIDKPTAAITDADLEMNSPYNLRKYRGLPPGPIANSGLPSIKSALHPVESKYWYYLHGKDGVIRYAETNEEQNENKRKYLQ